MPTGSQRTIGTGKGFARVTAITHPKILLNREMSNLDQIRRRKNKWALALLPAPTAPDFGMPWPQWAFFPLSGVGLGDIVPLMPMARALVMVEEFSGVMYLALVVSRLIALAVTTRRAV